MTSVSGPRVDPAPLFDLVTGSPPDDAVDVTVPMPLAIYMACRGPWPRHQIVAGRHRSSEA
jgi:hypothetical protein